jgi:lambda family phage tail tape measure protein
VIKTLIQMATQALITKAIMASFGGGAGGLFGSLFGGASGAASSGTAIQSAELIFHLTLGGVYDSPSLSAYSNGVYSTPQYFAFAKGAGVFGEAGRKPSCRLPVALMVRWGSCCWTGITGGTERCEAAAGKTTSLTGDINVNYHVHW